MSDLESIQHIIQKKQKGGASIVHHDVLSDFLLTSGIFLAWKIAILLQETIAVARFPIHAINQSWPNLLINIWATNWDAGNYLSIARNGFSNLTYAFFPLLPLTTRVISGLTHLDLPLTGLLITNISTLLFLFFLYRLLKFDLGELESRKTIFFFIIFPTAFFLQAFYTEAPFLLFTVLSFYFARKNKWWLVGIFGGLSTLTRTIGIFTFIPLLIEYFMKKKEDKKRLLSKDLLPLFIIPLTFLLYLSFLYLQTGNPLKFFQVQQYWGRADNPNVLLYPWDVLSQNLANISHQSSFFGGPIIGLIDFSFTFFALILLIFSLKQNMRLSYFIYTVITIIVPITTGSLTSMTRFLLVSFPLFITLNKLSQNNFLNYLLTFIFVFLQAQFILSFIFGLWVA